MSGASKSASKGASSPAERFKEREETLRALLSKVDADIARFIRARDALGKKREEINGFVAKQGLNPIPVAFTPSKDTSSLFDDLERHVLELNKVKNLIAARLNMVLKQEELFDKLGTKYGSAVSVKKGVGGDFELAYKDERTKSLAQDLTASQKGLDAVKRTVAKLEN